MSNIHARLDHLIDKFKHDVRDLIDSAVAEERTGLMNKLEAFIDTDGKSTDQEVVQFVKDKVEQIEPKVIVDIKASHEPLKALNEAVEPEMCQYCGVKPIAPNSRKYCSKECGNRAGAKAAYERKKVNKPEVKPKLLPAKAVTRKEPMKVVMKSPELSNRPLMEFVGKKKNENKPFICSFCGKPSDDRYCSKFCEDEDNRLKTLNKGKSYSEYLKEKGLKIKKQPTFRYEDRHE